MYYSKVWWTMTPGMSASNGGTVYNAIFIGSLGMHMTTPSTDGAVRPVIDLKSEVQYSSGSGTKTNPYVVEL
jgi:hypothetical protein